MKIALGQINTAVGDFCGNSEKILQYTRRAKLEHKADLIAFPELSLCGYPPRDLVETQCFIDQNSTAVEQLAHDIPSDISVVVGAVLRTHGHMKPRNAAVMMRNGRVELLQHKMLLPTYDVFDEWRNFEPGEAQYVFTLKGSTIGICICEDLWNNHRFNSELHKPDPYRRDPVTELVRKGAEIIISINASPYHIDKQSTIKNLLTDIASEHEVPVVWVNSVGGNDHLVFFGSSCVVNSNKQMIAKADSFAEDLICFDSEKRTGDNRWEREDKMHSVYNALVLGTRDYVKKCGFSKVVIGLSGGIDSAVTAAIAVDALGKDNVTGIGMPSQLSSDHSVGDAKKLAENLGIKFELIPIQGIVTAYTETTLTHADWVIQNLAYENLQARVRGCLLMSYSNSSGALVLTTGNKSELAVGYCTLYGDMCGGLAVISDVPKTMVYDLANYINQHSTRRETIPLNTITKPPSAELAPGQLDTDNLPPYDVLDRIIHGYVEENRCPEEISCGEGIAEELVTRVARMIDRNEYKRQQATVGLRITSKAFGYGRRFPIAKQVQHVPSNTVFKTKSA
jgi:NAD+ synthase (glutamine-hydrolysing)